MLRLVRATHTQIDRPDVLGVARRLLSHDFAYRCSGTPRHRVRFERVSMKDSANELLKTYRAQAIVHGSASETGDYRTGNRAHDRLYRAYYGLRDVGAEQLLLDLLDDGDASVRGWAGMHCLFINERKAKRALGGVARGNGIVASCAQMVLAQWRIGELELAPRTGKAPRKRKSKRGLTKRRRPPKREPARGANRDVTGDAEE